MMRNYGSQLQARATVKVLEDLGLEYEILEYRKKGLMFKLKNLHRIFNPVIIGNFLLAREKKKALTSIPQVAERNQLFDQYSKSHFKSKTVTTDYYPQLQKQALKYDAVITCSDQLWSPASLGTNFYDLMFVPEHIRKVSFASSFGVKRIPNYQRKKTKRYLERIEYISVRENQGAVIVKDLTGRDVPVLMDPVFVYSEDEWKDIVPIRQVFEFPYILCYFLGGNVEHRKRVKEFADEHGIKIVAINFCNSFIDFDKTFGNFIPFDVDPDKFLNILRGATYVCTDSFHGAAFSIIMKKQFAIFNRYSDNTSISRNSRIESLCENLGLNNCKAKETSNLNDILLPTIDYSKVDKCLNTYKEKTWNYLNNAFEGIKRK